MLLDLQPRKAKEPTFLTMRRSGQFTVETSGPNHCGLDLMQDIRYTIVCKCESDSKDSRGFLFDQVNVDTMFKSLGSTTVSCEELCERFARKLYALVMSENARAKVRKLKVTLSPAPYAASMSFEWERPE